MEYNGYNMKEANVLVQRNKSRKNVSDEFNEILTMTIRLAIIKSVMDHLGIILRKHNIRSVFGTRLKIRNILRSTKDGLSACLTSSGSDR